MDDELYRLIDAHGGDLRGICVLQNEDGDVVVYYKSDPEDAVKVLEDHPMYEDFIRMLDHIEKADQPRSAD